jgi:arsenate reductase
MGPIDKKRVLFICVHNSARSQIAEAFLNHMAGDMCTAESAGLAPGRLNPVVVEVMKEIGIDISKKKTNSAQDFYNEGRTYDYVITVCDEASAQSCPNFPGKAVKLHWSFMDPSGFSGTHEEIKEMTRALRDQIRSKVERFIVDRVDNPEDYDG